LETAEETWKIVKNYSYESTLNEITIKGNTATVLGSQTESMEILGQTMKQSSNGKMLIKNIDGRLQITRIESAITEL